MGERTDGRGIKRSKRGEECRRMGRLMRRRLAEDEDRNAGNQRERGSLGVYSRYAAAKRTLVQREECNLEWREEGEGGKGNVSSRRTA